MIDTFRKVLARNACTLLAVVHVFTLYIGWQNDVKSQLTTQLHTLLHHVGRKGGLHTSLAKQP